MKNARILLVTLFCMILPAALFGQTRPEVANIGNDNEVTGFGPLPTDLLNIGGTYQFEALYLANEMNLTADGELTAFEFYFAGGLTLGVLSETDIYVKVTDQNSLTEGDIDDPEGEGYTLVDIDAGDLSLLSLSADATLLRVELPEALSIDQGEHLSIHFRTAVTAGLNLSGGFYAESTGGQDLTQASGPGVLGLVGYGDMELRDLRPNVRLEFETEFELSAGNSIITAQRPEILADGSSTTLVTLQARTSTGENVNHGGDTVIFSTTNGSIGSANDNGDGTYTAVLTSASSPSTATITATLNGNNVGDDAQVQFVDQLTDLYCVDLVNQQEQIGQITSATTPRGPIYNEEVSLTLGTYQFEALYLQNELNLDGPGFLNYIEFFVDNDIDVDALGNFGIYIKETNATSLSDGDVSLDDYTFVGGNGALLSVSVSGQQRLRIEFETPFFYSNNANIAIHTRHFVLADVNLGGDFHYENTSGNRAKVSQDLLDVLGLITIGLTEPEVTNERPVVNFDFDLLTTADLSESSLTADPTQLPADGSSVSTITAMIRTAGGAVCVLESGAPEFLTTLGDLGTVNDEGDGVYTAPLTSGTPGIATVSAEIDGAALDDMPEVEFTGTVLPPDPDFTTITANPTQIEADGSSTSTVTVTLRDENDDPVTTGGFDVTLSTTAGSLSSVTDNGDGTYTATLTSSTTPGTAVITGTLEGDDIADDAEVEFVDEVLPPDPDFTTITANPTQIAANGSSTSTITVTLRDENDDPVTTGGFDVTLSTTAGTLSGVTDNGDGTYNATLTSSTSEETATITGTLEGDDIADDAQVEFVDDVLPPHPDFTTITANPTQIAADGSSTSTITVTLRDENDDPVTIGGYDVTLATDAGSLSSLADNGDGTYTATLTSSTNEETATITGTLEGDDIADDAQVEFVDDTLPPHPDFTTIEANPEEIEADGSSTSTITVTLRDENDNPVTTGGFDVDLSTTAGSLSGVTDNGDGTYTATLTSSTNEETATITGTLEGDDIADTAEVDFVDEVLPPHPDFTTIEADPTQIDADGSSTSTVTVTLRNENDNRVSEGGFDVTLSTTAGTLSDVTDNGDGTYNATLTSSTNEETATITGTLDGADIADTAEVDFVDGGGPPVTPDPDNITIDADPTVLPGDGTSESVITVTLYDEDGDRITEGGFCSDVDLQLNPGLGSLSGITDNGDGTCTAIYTAPNDTGTVEITGTYDGDDIDDSATIEIVAPNPSPDFTQITADPDRILADGESMSTITVTLYDDDNNRIHIGGFDIDLSTTDGTLSGVTDNGDGTYTATLTSSTTPGMAVITGTLEGEDIEDEAEVEFVDEFLPPSPEYTTIDADPERILSDGESTSEITVTLRDENDERISIGGYAVTLQTTAGTLGDVTDNGDGTFTAILTSSTNEETATITGTLEGEDINDSAEVVFTLEDEEPDVEPDPDNILIEADPTEIPADGASTSTITVTLFDQNGDAITQGGFCSSISLNTTMGTLSEVEDVGDGTCIATLTAPNQTGEAVITGTYSGEDIADDETIVFLSLDGFECKVSMNYPNPFDGPTTFKITSPAAGEISLELFDILGQAVGRVEENVTAGDGEIDFDGSHLSSGVYIYRYSCPCNCRTDTGRITRIGSN